MSDVQMHDFGLPLRAYSLSGSAQYLENLAELQAEGAKEAQLRGPIPFPQERLLSYFWNLLRSEGNDGCASDQNEGAARQQQSAEVFMLLRSLVSLRLLSQARMTAFVE